MDNNKTIIIGLVIVIIALVAVLALMLQSPAKEDVKLTITSKNKIFEGDNVKIKLTDINGTPINGETVNISITDKKGTTDYHSVVTDKKGVGKLKLDKDAGKYTVNCSYGGNENYTGDSASQKLTVKEEEVVETEPVSSSSSDYSESSSYSSDSAPVDKIEDGVYYDEATGESYQVTDIGGGYEIIKDDGSYVWTDYEGHVNYQGVLPDEEL